MPSACVGDADCAAIRTAYWHAMFEMVMERVSAIACGYKDAIDLDRLRHDPLMKVTVGRCPETGEPLASQSTISRLENSPSKTDAARLNVAMLDQFCATVKPGWIETFDIDDTFCAAHGGQQLAFWNADSRRARASRRCTSIMSRAVRRSPPSCARRAPRRARR